MIGQRLSRPNHGCLCHEPPLSHRHAHTLFMTFYCGGCRTQTSPAAFVGQCSAALLLQWWISYRPMTFVSDHVNWAQLTLSCVCFPTGGSKRCFFCLLRPHPNLQLGMLLLFTIAPAKLLFFCNSRFSTVLCLSTFFIESRYSRCDLTFLCLSPCFGMTRGLSTWFCWA